MNGIFRALLAGLLIVVLAYIADGLITYRGYVRAFEQTNDGESLQVVLERFGPPSHIEAKQDNVLGYDSGSRSVCGQSCWLRLWYELPFTLGITPFTIDFDAQQKVIHKYQWHSP